MAEVIVAFDLPGAREALELADRLPGLRWAKLGPMLLLAAGPDIIRAFKERGVKVFLDLKWHDIPHTVAGAVRAAAGLGVDLATVHTLGGPEMLRAAGEARGSMRLVGITVLTSHSIQSYGTALGMSEPNLEREVERLARLAAQAGLDGVVTSAREIGRVRAVLGDARWIVVPGIRPAGASPGDQQRIADPRQAAAAGATHLVVGRPIIEAEEPPVVYQAICQAAS